MKAKKKEHYVLVKVSAPADATAAQVRKEVRSLISHQCNYAMNDGDIKAKRVIQVPKGWVGDE